MDKKEGKLREFRKQLFPCRVKLNEFTEDVIAIRVGSLFQYFSSIFFEGANPSEL